MMKKVFAGNLISYRDQDNVIDRIKDGVVCRSPFSLSIGAAVIWMAVRAGLRLLSERCSGGRID